jgi:hypothetical protein
MGTSGGNPLIARPHTAYNTITFETKHNDKVVSWRFETDYAGGLNKHFLRNKCKRAFTRWTIQHASYIAITRRLKEAGEIMGIKILDHINVGDGEYLSFVERGLL